MVRVYRSHHPGHPASRTARQRHAAAHKATAPATIATANTSTSTLTSSASTSSASLTHETPLPDSVAASTEDRSLTQRATSIVQAADPSHSVDSHNMSSPPSAGSSKQLSGASEPQTQTQAQDDSMVHHTERDEPEGAAFASSRSVAPAASSQNSNPPLNGPAVAVAGGQIVSQPSGPSAIGGDPIAQWLQNAGALIRSREMSNFIASSHHLVTKTGGAIVHTACLPVTFPLHVVVSTSQGVAGLTTNVVHHLLRHNPLLSQQANGGESTSSASLDNMMHSIVPGVLQAAENIKNDLGSSALKVFAPFLGIIANGNSDQQSRHIAAQQEGRQHKKQQQPPAGQSSSEKDDFLDRLRLDFTIASDHDRTNEGNDDGHASQQAQEIEISTPGADHDTASTGNDSMGSIDARISFDTPRTPPQPKPWDNTMYLLRVDDFNLMHPKAPDQSLYCVDAYSDYASDYLTTVTLKAFTHRALAIVTTNKYMQLQSRSQEHTVASDAALKITWKAEGAASAFENEFAASAQETIFSKLEKSYCVWSGMFSNSDKFHKSDVPIYIARGLVEISPKDFFDLMWDSSRSEEYNHYSLGRSDLVVLPNRREGHIHADVRHHDSDSDKSGGDEQQKQMETQFENPASYNTTKIIHSETKLPFTGVSVQLCALMHADTLPDKDGYIIVTRSLHPGMAGCHTDQATTRIGASASTKNELLMGVNILRRVPGKPKCTDLISVNQVTSGFVPQFLAKRIGMAGLNDFFKNVRVIGEKTHAGNGK